MEYEARTNCAGAEGEVKMRAKALVAMGVLALLLAGYYAAAQTGEVYSLNVVGFQKITSKPGLRISSTPFDSETSDVNSVVGPQMTGGTGFGDADQMILYSPTAGYRMLYLRNQSGPTQIWDKWIDTSTGTIASNDIVPGMSWWLKNIHTATQTVVLVGDVVDDETFTNVIVEGLQLVAYPYAEEKSVQELNLTSNAGAVAGTGIGDADNIYFYDPDKGYVTLYLRNNTGPLQIQNKWIDTSIGNVATNIVQPGQGFWYKHRGTGFLWIETRPYTLNN